MKKDWAKYLLALIFILVLIPLGVAFMLSFRFIITDTTNEWIGFWGGYLGAILGGMITLYVLWKTIKEEKEISIRQEKIVYFDNIIHVWAKIVQSTYNLEIYICRCHKEKNNDNVEKTYREHALVTGILSELKILLETRKDVYDVGCLLSYLEVLETQLEKTRDEYDEECSETFIKSGKEAEGKELDELRNVVEKISESIEKTVVKNINERLNLV